jgi:DNA-binding transcriptional LysR family regulator
LTGEGEQLLNDCRTLLNHAKAVGERAQMLRRGDTGILKVAASPQFLESVISAVLHRFAKSYPDVQVTLVEAVGIENLAMVERGEIHLGQNLLHAIEPNDPRFASQRLGSVELLAASAAPLTPGTAGVIDIGRLASIPLLVLEAGFSVRRTFDAACRLAGLKPRVRFESRAPQTLLALALAGHGVAIIPSTLRVGLHDLQIARVTCRGRPIREPVTFVWDRRRPLPPYAAAFCEMCAEHVRQVFPVTRPSPPKSEATARRSAPRRRRDGGSR